MQVTLTKPDIGLWTNFAATRFVLDILQTADHAEEHDSAMVWFDTGLPESDPVEFRGQGRRAPVACKARFVHSMHPQAVQLTELFRAARRAPDARLMMRTNAGLASGFDRLLVGKVSAWSRPLLMGQSYDVTWTFDPLVYELDD